MHRSARADPASERILLAVDQPFANHNGGQVVSFGEDAAGELYVLSSDGHVWRIVAGE